MNQEQIGKFIAKQRKEKNLTQAQLGEKLNVTNKTISRWENGNYMPDISILSQLCNELEINLNELLSGKKLEDNNYKEQAEENLINSLKNIKKIKSEQKKLEFLSGAGTGILISSIDKANWIILSIGFILIAISWYCSSKYNKMVLENQKIK